MQSRQVVRAVFPVLAVSLLVACSGTPESPPVPASSRPAEIAAPAPAPTDEASLRRAASAALAEQRIYAPVGANAIEHYLALRNLRPDDGGLATALLELLPYAVIGSEQAMERGDLDEARRLVALVAQVDPQFPAITRLRDRIVATELREAQRVAREAEAEALRQQQLLLDARREAEASAASPPVATPSIAAAEAPAPVPAPVPVPAEVVPAPVPAPVVAPTAAAPPPQAIPRLLSAPSPRYPPLALRRKLEGEVTVQFTIQPDGSVTDPRVVSANPPGQFEEAALVATRRWRFEASGRSVQTTRVVQFRLAAAQP